MNHTKKSFISLFFLLFIFTACHELSINIWVNEKISLKESQSQVKTNKINLSQTSSLPCFTSVWRTDYISNGSSGFDQVRLPLIKNGEYHFRVDWGDGKTNIIDSWSSYQAIHTYIAYGEYTIRITGVIRGFCFANNGDRLKLIEIKSWGPLNLGNKEGYFWGAKNLKITAPDKLDLKGTSSLRRMFADCNISYIPGIEKWDVSEVTDMSTMFLNVSLFNQDLGNWNVSNVTNMSGLFSGTSFNYDIGNWDVSKVISLHGMFSGNEYFNQDIGYWDVSSATHTKGMFGGSISFNQNLGHWNVSNIVNMHQMFDKVTLSSENYDKLLIGWAASKNLKKDVKFSGGLSKYSPKAEAARKLLIEKYNWKIIDGGPMKIKPL